VVPDVKTSAKNALDVAQLAIVKDLLTAETDPVWQHKLKERIQELE
jgi:hypothetical protein